MGKQKEHTNWLYKESTLTDSSLKKLSVHIKVKYISSKTNNFHDKYVTWVNLARLHSAPDHVES